MTLEIIRDVLACCSLINIVLLIIWFLFFIYAHDFMYRFHGKWFKLSEGTFDAIHYGSIAFFEIVILVFNIVPYLALRIVG